MLKIENKVEISWTKAAQPENFRREENQKSFKQRILRLQPDHFETDSSDLHS